VPRIPDSIPTIESGQRVIAQLSSERSTEIEQVLDARLKFLRARDMVARAEREYKALADLFWIRVQEEIEQADSAHLRGMALGVRADAERQAYLVVEFRPDPDADGFMEFLRKMGGDH
jgi:hypothetical protein